MNVTKIVVQTIYQKRYLTENGLKYYHNDESIDRKYSECSGMFKNTARTIELLV